MSFPAFSDKGNTMETVSIRPELILRALRRMPHSLFTQALNARDSLFTKFDVQADGVVVARIYTYQAPSEDGGDDSFRADTQTMKELDALGQLTAKEGWLMLYFYAFARGVQ